METTWRHQAIVGVLLFGITLAIFLASPAEQIADSHYTCLISEGMYKHGEVTLDRYLVAPLNPARHPPLIREPPGEPFRIGYPMQVEHHDGHIHYRYPLGSSVLSIPLVMVANAAGLSATARDGGYHKDGERRLQRILAALLMAGFTSLAYFTASLLLGPVPSIAVTLAIALASPIWSTASRALWSHTWSVVLLGVVVWLLLREELTGRRAPPVLLGSLLAWSYFVRPTNALSLVCVLVFLFVRDRRRATRVALTAGAWLLAFALFTWLTRGAALPRYYQGGTRRHVLLAALAGNLLSPSRGLLVFCPWVGLVIAGALRSCGSLRALARLACAIVFLQVLVISTSPTWWGGHCYGPRLMTEVMPWIVLLAILASKVWIDEGAWGGGLVTRTTMILLALLVGWSVLVHGVGAISRDATPWNARPRPIEQAPERMWDWAHPQFLAPFQSPAPLPPRTYGGGYRAAIAATVEAKAEPR